MASRAFRAFQHIISSHLTKNWFMLLTQATCTYLSFLCYRMTSLTNITEGYGCKMVRYSIQAVDLSPRFKGLPGMKDSTYQISPSNYEDIYRFSNGRNCVSSVCAVCTSVWCVLVFEFYQIRWFRNM